VIRRLPAFAWLVVLWVGLWGDFTLANLLGGVLVAGVVTTVFRGAVPGPAGSLRPLRFLRFLVWFAWKVLEANLIVAWECISPRNRLNLAVVAVPLRGGSDVAITSVANAISLTPGTLTVEVREDPPTLYVHVLHLRSIERSREELIHLEWLILRAIDPDLADRDAWNASAEPETP
jgi:multicomponent Na+:H+ antiporter subunit E